jgi:hypothetical protein
MSRELTVFNPFDLYIGARYHEPVEVQDVINYCADRFRGILNDMRDRYRGHEIPSWFNKTLETEVVCTVQPLTASWFPTVRRLLR